MEDYKELAEKIVGDLQRRHFVRGSSGEATKILVRNIAEILNDHFKPDKGMRDRCRIKYREWISVEDVDDYDSGLINGHGGGNVQWWQDYIRSEVNRCNQHWRDAFPEPPKPKQ